MSTTQPCGAVGRLNRTSARVALPFFDVTLSVESEPLLLGGRALLDPGVCVRAHGLGEEPQFGGGGGTTVHALDAGDRSVLPAASLAFTSNL